MSLALPEAVDVGLETPEGDDGRWQDRSHCYSRANSPLLSPLQSSSLLFPCPNPLFLSLPLPEAVDELLESPMGDGFPLTLIHCSSLPNSPPPSRSHHCSLVFPRPYPPVNSPIVPPSAGAAALQSYPPQWHAHFSCDGPVQGLCTAGHGCSICWRLPLFPRGFWSVVAGICWADEPWIALPARVGWPVRPRACRNCSAASMEGLPTLACLW
jgi:hypothetical protein